MRVWTLGYGPVYEIAVRTPGNAKAPGGYAFRTREDAEAYAASHLPECQGRLAWEMEIPGSFEDCTTTDWRTAQEARHAWHQGAPWDNPSLPDICGVCREAVIGSCAEQSIDCSLLIVSAPFINPDTGEVC